jgi:hypothetical protein
VGKRTEQVVKLLTVVSMLLTTGWLVAKWREPGFPWEPTIGLITCAIGYMTIESKQQGRISEVIASQTGNDAALFLRLQEFLPSHGAIDFIKHHDFGGSFILTDLDPVSRFVHEWNNPQHEFIDPVLEAQRANLLRAASYFANAIAFKTAPRHAAQSAVPGHIDSDGPFPDWVKRDIRQIHQAAEALVDEHEKMMRLGRRMLPLNTQVASGV